jgi:hypothetical protein
MAALDTATPAILAEAQRRRKRLAAFKDWLDSTGNRPRFTSTDDLRAKVLAALHGWRARHPTLSGPTERPARSRPADPTTYLRRLRDRTATIDIRGLEVGRGRANNFPIEDLYISLTTTGSAPATARRGPGRGDKLGESSLTPPRKPLHDALSHPRLVVVGDPGSGKTTFAVEAVRARGHGR